MREAALVVVMIIVGLFSGLMLDPRRTAQVALACVPLEFAYYLVEPFTFAVLAPVVFGVTLWPIAWYLVFTLPLELVDRHAELTRVYVDPPAQRQRTGPMGL